MRGDPQADLVVYEKQRCCRVSRLVEEISEISELDLNPIFALPEGQGCKIVDARIRLGINHDYADRPMIRSHRSAVTEGGT